MAEGVRLPSYFKKTLSAESTNMLMIWTFFMGLALIVIYIQGVIEARAYPMNSFLPHRAFGDFYGTFNQYVQAHGLGGIGYGLAYFPAIYLPIQFLTFLTTNPVFAMWMSQSVWFLGSTTTIYYTLKSKGFLVSAVGVVLITFSYPSLFSYNTGNIEAWVGFLLLLAAFFAFRSSWLGFGLIIGVAGGYKGMPLLFLIIPWIVCEWRVAIKTTLVSISTTITLTIAALTVLPGGIIGSGINGVRQAISAILRSQQMYSALMVDTSAGTHYGHSFLNAVHAIWGLQVMPSSIWGPTLFILIGGFSLVVLLKLKSLESPLWMIFAVVGSAGCLMPATSTDYKLLYLAPSILIFLASANRTSKWGAMPIYLVIFAMSPKPWLYVGTDPYGNASVYLTAASLILIPLVCLTVGRWGKHFRYF